MPQDDGTYNKDAAEKQYTIYAQKDNSERNDRKSKFWHLPTEILPKIDIFLGTYLG